MEKNQLKILSIDDHLDNLISLKALIREAFPDAIPLMAGDGPAGIDLALSEDPDVILLDVVMPGMDGFEVCQKLKSDPKTGDIPVVFISRLKGDKDSRIWALEVGAEAFLAKPIDETELTAQIRAMVKIKTANNQKRQEKEVLAYRIAEQTCELNQAHTATSLLLEDFRKENEARKLNVVDLQITKKFLEEAQRISHLGNWEWDLITNQSTWSSELYQIYGRDQAMGTPSIDQWLENIHPDDRISLQNAIQSGMISGNYRIDYRILRYDNAQIRWIHAEGEVAFEGEKPVSLRGVAQDITERKQAEEALVRSEAQFRAVVENSNDGILFGDANATIMYRSPSYTRMIGFSDEERLGHSGFELVHPDDAESLHQWWDQVVQQPKARFRTEYRIRHKDGTWRWINTTAQNLLDHPDIQKIIVTSSDITERKQAEETLRESEALFRTAYESSLAGIGMVGADGKFIRVNSQLCKMLGYTQQELLRLTFNDITFEEDQDYSLTTLKQIVTGEIDNASFEKRYIKKNGDIIWVFISISAIRDKNRQYQYHVTYIQDITARKWSQIELQSSLDKLRKTTEGTIETLAHIVEARDPYTSGHQKRVADISVAVAEDLGLSEEQIRGIYYASLIHDLGKIQVPSEILSKPGKLTKLEYELIKIHPEVSFDLLKDVDFPWPIAEIIYQHHERMDGSGYPRQLKGDGILLEAKIIAVADVIDAMSTHRPYRPALGLDDALAEIEKNKGTLYDAVIVEAFLKVIRKGKKHG